MSTLDSATDQRSIEDFMRAAIERKITRWDIHKCSGCGYACGYVIDGEGLFYDNGCWCSGGMTLSPRPWESLADHYNRNQPSRNPQSEGKPWLAEMRAFWGFDGADEDE